MIKNQHIEEDQIKSPHLTPGSLKILTLAFIATLIIIKSDYGELTITLSLILLCLAYQFLSKSIYDSLSWLIVSIPFDIIQWPLMNIYVSLSDIMLVLFLLRAFFQRHNLNMKMTPPVLLGLVTILAIAVGYLFSPLEYSVMRGVAMRAILSVGTFIVICNLVPTTKDLRTIFRAYSFMAPVFFIVLIMNGELQEMLNAVIEMERPTHSHTLPLILTLALPLITLKKYNSAITFLISFLYMGVILLCQSLITIPLGIATVMVTYWSSGRFKEHKFSPILSILILFVIIYFASLTSGYNEVIRETVNRDQSLRQHKLEANLNTFYSYPITGVGPGGSYSRDLIGLYEAWTEGRGAAENGILQVLAELGLIGTVPFIMLILYMFLKLFRISFITDDRYKYGIWILYISTIIYLLYSDAAWFKMIWCTWALVCLYVQMGEGKLVDRTIS